MKKGILLIAVGHPNYGKMAANLAATIKCTGTTIPIHLAHNPSAVSHLSDSEMDLFDSFELIPDDYITPAFIRSKMFMYDLSPFKETIFLDVDIVWFKKKPEELFEQFQEVSFSFTNHGYQNQKSIWADFSEVREAYKLSDDDRLYGIHSELMYFKKCKEVKKYFDTAKKIYDNLKVKATVFAGAIPDELPFTIAGALCKMYPHEDEYRPIWWRSTDKNGSQIHELYENYFAMSMGGNNSTAMSSSYNVLAKAAYYKLGIKKGPYQWKAKREFLPERSKI